MEIFSKIQSLCQNLNLNTDGCPKNYKFDKCAEWNHAINRQQLQGEYQKKTVALAKYIPYGTLTLLNLTKPQRPLQGHHNLYNKEYNVQ